MNCDPNPDTGDETPIVCTSCGTGWFFMAAADAELPMPHYRCTDCGARVTEGDIAPNLGGGEELGLSDNCYLVIVPADDQSA
ncbi:hypothetical protein [Streptomyces sp. NPDC087300]|uniref:hypothetical protein n=1 Tax=Streptomyces sp. NPDC087300 TaxID=3365780 RepID=UPI00380FDC07